MTMLVVGLGNPGNQYVKTRHNAGFWFLDSLATISETNFAYKKKFDADEAITSQKIRLLKPQTFMNNSGFSVLAAVQFYQIPITEILVVHDEVDLAAGIVKLKKGGGHAGHNGLRDISQRLGNADYWRLRIGVGKPAFGAVSDHVLAAASSLEQEVIDNSLNRALDCWHFIANGDYNNAMKNIHSENK